MSEDWNIDQTEERKPRPGFLTVLCVLSFISTGLGFISGGFNFILGPSDEETMLQTKVEMTTSITELRDLGMNGMGDMLEQIQLMTEDINRNFYLASVISLLIIAVGFFSVFKMWNGFKIGFHLYIAYNLLSLVGMYIYVSPAHIPNVVVIFNVLFSGLFIFLYSRNLHWLTQ